MTASALYRIYTQDEPGYRDTIIQALQNRGFQYFTFISGIGYGPGQDGKPENTVIIDVATEWNVDNVRAIHAVVEDIRRNNEQKAVLLVDIPAYRNLVTVREEEGSTMRCVAYKRDENGRPIVETETVVGKIVARYGKWKKLLGSIEAMKIEIVRGGIVVGVEFSQIEAP